MQPSPPAGHASPVYRCTSPHIGSPAKPVGPVIKPHPKKSNLLVIQTVPEPQPEPGILHSMIVALTCKEHVYSTIDLDKTCNI